MQTNGHVLSGGKIKICRILIRLKCIFEWEMKIKDYCSCPYKWKYIVCLGFFYSNSFKLEMICVYGELGIIHLKG